MKVRPYLRIELRNLTEVFLGGPWECGHPCVLLNGGEEVLFVSTRVRFLAGFGAAALALSLAACGSEADKARNATGSPTVDGTTVDGTAADAGSQDCPDKHEATVEDDVFGGTADIDLCALPDTHKTTLSASWARVSGVPDAFRIPLNLAPVSCASDSEDSCKQTRVLVDERDTCNSPEPDCHPQRGEELSVVCSVKDPAGASTVWYGVLLNKRLLATGGQNNDSSPQHYTDKGSRPIGYMDAKNVNKVSGDLPTCDGTVLHGKWARNLAQLEGVPLGL